VHLNRFLTTVVALVEVVRTVTKIVVEAKHDSVPALAVRAPVSAHLEPLLEWLHKLSCEEQHGIVGTKPYEQPNPGQRCSEAEQQKDDGDDDYCIIPVELKLSLPEFQLQGSPWICPMIPPTITCVGLFLPVTSGQHDAARPKTSRG
jgi:hypothetical protein